MAFPFFGKIFEFKQPDGSLIHLRGWGDQDSARFETLEGLPMARNPGTGYFEPAGPDQAEMAVREPVPGLLEAVAREEPRWKTRRRRKKAQLAALAFTDANLEAPPPTQVVGDYVGLCLLIDFPDARGTIPREEVDRFCNQRGYSGFGNNGSVYDYFSDNSLGRLRHRTIVTPYYTAARPKSYYAEIDVPYTQRAIELITEALAHHQAQGFDFSSLSSDDQGHVLSVSAFYAGKCTNERRQGLWPHQWFLPSSLQIAPGKRGGDYQITDMEAELALGTYCHEMGHMLCDFPDLYDDGHPETKKQSFGVGYFCLMGFGGHADPKNPVQVCAYLKLAAGWANSLTVLESNGDFTASAGTNDFFVRSRGGGEYFLIENRFSEGRDRALPHAGLAIWHVEECGDNSYEQMTAEYHYECSLEQADGLFELERGITRNTDHRDLFRAGWKSNFSADTRPNSSWWDGSASGLQIHDIGPAGRQIKFSVTLA